MNQEKDYFEQEDYEEQDNDVQPKISKRKLYWMNMSPEQRAERIRKMQEGRKRSKAS